MVYSFPAATANAGNTRRPCPTIVSKIEGTSHKYDFHHIAALNVWNNSGKLSDDVTDGTFPDQLFQWTTKNLSWILLDSNRSFIDI
jgi:hypothetical protein